MIPSPMELDEKPGIIPYVDPYDALGRERVKRPQSPAFLRKRQTVGEAVLKFKEAWAEFIDTASIANQ